MEITGNFDVDEFIYFELHKILNKELCNEIRTIDPNFIWNNPSDNLKTKIRCDRGAQQHFYNDIWYNMNDSDKNYALNYTYGAGNYGVCLNCKYYGFPCRNCCEYCLPMNQDFNYELFQANFDIREPDEEFCEYYDSDISDYEVYDYWSGRD